MTIEVISRAPASADFVALSTHQSRTPASFFGGSAVLHYEHPAVAVVASRAHAARLPVFPLSPAPAPAPASAPASAPAPAPASSGAVPPKRESGTEEPNGEGRNGGEEVGQEEGRQRPIGASASAVNGHASAAEEEGGGGGGGQGAAKGDADGDERAEGVGAEGGGGAGGEEDAEVTVPNIHIWVTSQYGTTKNIFKKPLPPHFLEAPLSIFSRIHTKIFFIFFALFFL